MNLKRSLAAAVLFGGFSLTADAGSIEKLVEALKANGYLTEEQAREILAEAKKEEEKGGLTEGQKRALKVLEGLTIGGKAFLHYDYTLTGTNKSEDDYNEFNVARAYFDVRKYFEDNNYFRLTTDVYKDQNNGYVVRLKYAYFNWTINDFLQTEIGLAHRPAIDWLQKVVWKHRYMEKTFLEDRDGADLINSADLGIALKGSYGKLGYMFGIYNGEGYKAAENDHRFGKSVEGRVNYEPLEGLTLALHAAYIDNTNYWNGNTTGEVDRLILQPLIVYENRYFLVGGQFFYNKDMDYYANATAGSKDFNNYGWSINVDLKLRNMVGVPLTLFARYGEWNYDDDWTTLNAASLRAYDRRQLLVGVEHRFNKHLRLGAAYKYVKYDMNDQQKQTANVDRSYKQLFRTSLEVNW